MDADDDRTEVVAVAGATRSRINGGMQLVSSIRKLNASHYRYDQCLDHSRRPTVRISRVPRLLSSSEGIFSTNSFTTKNVALEDFRKSRGRCRKQGNRSESSVRVGTASLPTFESLPLATVMIEPSTVDDAKELNKIPAFWYFLPA